MKYIFDDVLEIKNGKNQKAVENPDGKYPIYGSGGVMGYADDYICNADTVIIGRKGSINNPIYVNEPFWNVDTAFGLEARKELLHPRYLFYFCKKYDFEKLNKTVTIPSLTKSDLLKVQIDIPEMSNQEKVVKNLGILEQIIELRQEELTMLDELIKARFVELFGEGLKDDGRFDLAPISEIGRVVSGATPKTSNAEYWDGENLWVTPAELSDESYIIYDTERKITDEGAKSCAVNLLPVGTVILSSRAPIGKVAIAGAEMYCNQGFKNIIPNTKINSVYLFELLKMETEYLNSLGRGATFKEISKQIVENICIKVPPRELQDQFAEFVKQIDKSKVAVQKSLDETQKLFDSLMQEYFG